MKPRKRKKKKTISVKRIFTWALVAFSGCLVFAALLIYYISRELPPPEQLENFDPELTTRIFSSDGKVLKELYTRRRVLVPLKRMSRYMPLAAIATEDYRFFDHWGFSLRDFIRALAIDIITLRFSQGASTLTQQLARNLYDQIGFKKNIVRKMKEGITAIQIERRYTKREILEMYLNSIYFGHGVYGVQAAAKRYFNKHASELSLDECALLMGIPRSPAYYSPINHPDRAFRRRNIVLKMMRQRGFIGDTEYKLAVNMPIQIRQPQEEIGLAPYFTEYIRQQLEEENERLGVDIYRDGLSIYTTLDSRLQIIADSLARQHLLTQQEILNRRLLSSDEEIIKLIDTTRYPLDSVKLMIKSEMPMADELRSKLLVQLGLIALEPSTGKILAMIGGRDFEKSKWNRAVQAKRQPGSVFKPFIYTAAIDNGYPVTTQLLNQPVVLFLNDSVRWTPRNYTGKTGGLTTLREGLRWSYNLVAVRLVQELVPPSMVVEYAHKMGITTPLRAVDAIALGTSEVIPLEVTSAYCIFPNKGVWVQPYGITKIVDRFGNVLKEYHPEQREVLSEATAYIMTNMLQTVVDKGTGGSARWKYHFRRPAGGKTGTTNDYTDAWFVGFTPQIATGVWVGIDDPSVSLGKDQAGSRAALPLWARFMREAHKRLHLPVEDFQRPESVVEMEICSVSKDLPTKYCPVEKEIFNVRYKPTELCKIHTTIGKQQSPNKVVF